MPRQGPAALADVQEMVGAIWYFLWSQGDAAFARSLPPDLLDLLNTTKIAVVDSPTPRDVAAVGVPKGSLLLGLYTYPPALIQIFADGVLAAHHDPVDVFEHELGHRFGFDHSTHPVSTGIYADGDGKVRCTSFHPETVKPTDWPGDGQDRGSVMDDEACPFCRLHNRTAEVTMLLEGLRRRAWLMAQPTLLPTGLGGTIPLARRKLSEAHDALLEASNLFPDRRGEVRMVDGLLHRTQERLAGHITSEETTAAWEAAHAAWDAAYSLYHSYILSTKYPGVNIHDLP